MRVLPVFQDASNVDVNIWPDKPTQNKQENRLAMDPNISYATYLIPEPKEIPSSTYRVDLFFLWALLTLFNSECFREYNGNS